MPSRLSGVGLLADTGPTERAKELRIQHGDLKSIPSKILHNRLSSMVYDLSKLSRSF